MVRIKPLERAATGAEIGRAEEASRHFLARCHTVRQRGGRAFSKWIRQRYRRILGLSPGATHPELLVYALVFHLRYDGFLREASGVSEIWLRILKRRMARAKTLQISKVYSGDRAALEWMIKRHDKGTDQSSN